MLDGRLSKQIPADEICSHGSLRTSGMKAQFSTTQWSQVLAARDGAGTEARQALAVLCETYWYPLYVFVRREGYDADAARDLTQGFFAYLLEKEVLQQVQPSAGRFRSFLLATLRHFISRERGKDQALKRGGGTQTISVDAAAAEARYDLEPTDELTPEQVFESRWAMTVLDRAMERLRQESGESGDLERFQKLQPYLTGQKPRLPYNEIAVELQMTEGAVKTAVYRMRQQFGLNLRQEIAETVADPSEIDDEVRYLLSVLRPFQNAPA